MSERFHGEPRDHGRIARCRDFMREHYGSDFGADDAAIERCLAEADRIIQDIGPMDGSPFYRTAERLRRTTAGPHTTA